MAEAELLRYVAAEVLNQSGFGLICPPCVRAGTVQDQNKQEGERRCRDLQLTTGWCSSQTKCLVDKRTNSPG